MILAFLYRFSSNFVWELILGRSVLGLQMGKFRQICIELWPFIYFTNWFSLSISGISLPIFFKLCYRFSSNFAWGLILGRSFLVLQMSKFRQMCTELWPLIYVWNWFSLSIFGISLPIFFKLCMRVDIGKECFLAHLSQRLIGELIGYSWSVVHPSVRRPSLTILTISNVFFSKTACPIKAKFYVEPPWVGGTKVCSRHLGHMTKMAARPIYGKNPSKIFFSRTCRPIFTKLGM